MADASPSTTPDPAAPSSSYNHMAPYWNKVGAILAGVDAMRHTMYSSVYGPHMAVPNLRQLNRGRTGPESPYLPRFENETTEDYTRRRLHAPMTNIYSDISANLASKPFSKTCELDPSASKQLKDLQQNIDGQGNNLHVFASSYFKDAIDKAVDWILVDYTRVPPGATLADERTMGARPYWVHVSAESLVAVYSKFLNGVEVIYHARISEVGEDQSGYGEETFERVREFNREPIVDAEGRVLAYGQASWVLWEKQEDDQTKKSSWVPIDGGILSIGIIPLVPLVLGRRKGASWRIEPPMRDLVDMQIEDFQQESNLKAVTEMTAFPMYSGNGVSPPKDEQGNLLAVPVGPRGVLFAPMSQDGRHGEWKILEPAGASLTFLQTKLEKHQTEMRNLGKQPLTTTNLTVVTTANVAMKAHNAVQAWALRCKDALEQAWKITAMWVGSKESPTVKIHTDFLPDLEGKKPDMILKAEQQAIISKKTAREELHRTGVLSDDFVPEDEEQRLAEEQQGLEPEVQYDPVSGLPIAPKLVPPALTPAPAGLN